MPAGSRADQRLRDLRPVRSAEHGEAHQLIQAYAGRIAPILLPYRSVNHRLPSGPEAMPWATGNPLGIGYSVSAPCVVIRPTLPLPLSANQRLSSGPNVMP